MVVQPEPSVSAHGFTRAFPYAYMLLVVPRIDIREGRCEFAPSAFGPHLLADPVQMAMLWRVQNAKTLVLTDLPGDSREDRRNVEAIKSVCEHLDIPVQVDCSQNPELDPSVYLGCGAYRLILSADMDASRLHELLERHGARRFAIALGRALEQRGIAAIEPFDSAGCCRYVATVSPRTDPSLHDWTPFRIAIERAPRARFSVEGATVDYPSLLAAEESAPTNVDSAIIGPPLYANRFPCQKTWCWNRATEVELSRFTTATVADPSVGDSSGRK